MTVFHTTWLKAWIAIFAIALAAADAKAQGIPVICPGCDLKGQDYSGQTLTGPNFAGADLTGAKFSDTVIIGGNFIDADLNGADFQAVMLQADARGVPTMFQDADLTGANFTGATIDAADFQYADLSCSSFPKVNLSNAVFGPRLAMKSLAGCTADFTEAVLTCEFAHAIDALDRDRAELPDCTVALEDGTAVDPWSTTSEVESDEANGSGDERDNGISKSGVSMMLMAPANVLERSVKASSQTVFVAPEGTDAPGCGASVSSYCKTISFAAGQCNFADCTVALEYGKYAPAAAIAPGKGAITVAGGYVGGKPVGTYQSQITAPPDGVPAFDLTAKDSGIILSHLLVIGTSPSAPKVSAQTVALRASATTVTLENVNVLAAPGTTGPVPGDGSSGADGKTGDPGTSSKSPGAGGASTCGAAGGTGGKTVSNKISSSFTWYLVCEYDCDLEWQNAANGQPGGTGTYASGSSLKKKDALACYACPDGRGSLPKSAATGTAGSNGSCGAGGQASTDTAGSFDASGVWSGSTASSGGAGLAGGGGGGGGPGGSCGYANCVCHGSTYNGGAGGGGGSGGCGATPGKGGNMGAASFGIVLVGAKLGLTGDPSVVTGARSGDGSAGGAGQKGGAAGSGGAGKSFSNYCNDGGASGAKGGAGGIGGASGGGGGGNSGPSVNIALTGSGASMTGTPVFYLGAAGQGGGKGAAGVSTSNCTATDAADGNQGLVATTHTF
ncbi:pentapeptide repeat-containing protein [Roseovarius aestuariivivens]|uniref:pentapeptide repeat-containing protein n=1 Tax=Roseovarius aestuariivivens TaxID=1888910 RepID=UPI001436B45D|nr:pentapeptide repeat-containing protein [Roseovarius aestuariivivens]